MEISFLCRFSEQKATVSYNPFQKVDPYCIKITRNNLFYSIRYLPARTPARFHGVYVHNVHWQVKVEPRVPAAPSGGLTKMAGE